MSESYKLCMVKKTGRDMFSFYFGRPDDYLDFYGDNFEQKPASICQDLLPKDDAYEYVFSARDTSGHEFAVSEKSNIYSMQDSLDDCVALMFDRDYEAAGDKKGRLVLRFGDDILDVSDKLFSHGFELQDGFPEREPTDFLSEMLNAKADLEDECLAFVRLVNAVPENVGDKRYTYKFYFCDRSQLETLGTNIENSDVRQIRCFGPVELSEVKFTRIEEQRILNVKLDTIEMQNGYSMGECIDGCVCVASENIDGMEYPEHRLVFHIGDNLSSVEIALFEKGFFKVS